MLSDVGDATACEWGRKLGTFAKTQELVSFYTLLIAAPACISGLRSR